MRAHPRAGGENNLPLIRGLKDDGSSPRGRGKLQEDVFQGREGRLIPARAGKTQSRPADTRMSLAHPRAGGENLRRFFLCGSSIGSSPRGRGKLDRAAPSGSCAGLIPARAGKTLSDLRFYRADRSDLGNP